MKTPEQYGAEIQSLQMENQRLRNECENALQDAQQSDVNTLRALHERNQAREQLTGFVTMVIGLQTQLTKALEAVAKAHKSDLT